MRNVLAISIQQVSICDPSGKKKGIKKPFFSAYVSAVFLKEQTDLIQKFRNGLEKILGNGTYQRIIEEYYGKDLVLEDIVPENLHDKIESVKRNTP